jgi:hypothetical protein
MKQKRPLSYSSLKQFDVSPNHLLAYWNRDLEPSSAQIKGTLIHTLTLEPDTFVDKYAIFEGKVKRGKAYDEFLELNTGKTVISVNDYNEASEVAAAVQKNEAVHELFMETNAVEQLVEWEYEGLKFKGFIDGKGAGFNFDLKSCASSEPNKFTNDCFKFGYPIQGAMYNIACGGTGLEDYFIIAVENKKPYNVTLFKMSEDLLQYGLNEYHRMIEAFKQWDGEPTGYSDIVVPLDFPNWYTKQKESIDTF